ncbi:MAG: hypothetical protein QM831_45340 [Kofleriaceae bacterium]
MTKFVWVLVPTIAAAQPGPPSPAKEVTAYVKANAGTWTCSGNVWMPDGKPYPVTATLVVKGDLNDFWVHETFAGKMAMGAFTFETYATHDAGGWHAYVMTSLGGYASGSDSEMTGSDPFGKYTLHLKQAVDKGAWKRSAERSLDGKTWVHDYDVTCKK